LALTGFFGSTEKAIATPLYFEFSADPNLMLPDQGTVTGEIDGLDLSGASDGVAQHATTVIIQTIPDGMPNVTSLTTPISMTYLTDPKWNIFDNEFTVVSGAVTDANFLAQEFDSADGGNGYLSINGNETGVNELSLDYVTDGDYGILNLNGLDPDQGVAFSETPFTTASPTPEPASFGLISIGAAMLLRRQRVCRKGI
jgi:hypothetical protein